MKHPKSGLSEKNTQGAKLKIDLLLRLQLTVSKKNYAQVGFCFSVKKEEKYIIVQAYWLK